MAAQRSRRRDQEQRAGFLFLANQLALDFVNTRPVMEGKPVELIPDFNASLRWFTAAGVLDRRQALSLQRRWAGSVAARRFIEDLGHLREELRKQLLDWERGYTFRRSTMDRLNNLLAKHPMRTRLAASARGPLTSRYIDPVEPADLFAPIAQSTAELFAGAERTRVRKCAECVLHFYDTSKKGNRRWCSMRLCGNREKVAAYAARRRTRG